MLVKDKITGVMYDPVKMELVFEYSYGEESYGLVYKDSEGMFQVFEIPQYGGFERYCETFDNIDDAIKEAKSYT